MKWSGTTATPALPPGLQVQGAGDGELDWEIVRIKASVGFSDPVVGCARAGMVSNLDSLI